MSELPKYLRTCVTCDGRGECFAMDGTGRRWDCPHCGGSGKVKRESQERQISDVRDEFAKSAMVGIISAGAFNDAQSGDLLDPSNAYYGRVAQVSYEMADAMLAARGQA